MLVDGDVDDGVDLVNKAGHGGGFVDVAGDAVLRVDADDDDVAHFLRAHLLLEEVFRVEFGGVQQAAQAEVVGESAVKEVDVGAFGAVFVGAALGAEFASRLAAQAVVVAVVVEQVLQTLWQGVAAGAAVVVEGERAEDERHGAGGGHGAGKAQFGEIQAEEIKVFLGKFNARAQGHVGGGDDGERALAGVDEVGEGGAAKERGFQLFL